MRMNKFDDEEECLQYLIDHNLIIERKCDSCQELAIAVKRNGKYHWRCRKTKIVTDEAGNSIKTKCDFMKSVLANTWFFKVKVPLKKIFILLKLYLQETFSAKQASEMLQMNKNTITDYLMFFREVIIDYLETNKFSIGGEHKVVEIDECKLGKRKHHKG